MGGKGQCRYPGLERLRSGYGIVMICLVLMMRIIAQALPVRYEVP